MIPSPSRWWHVAAWLLAAGLVAASPATAADKPGADDPQAGIDAEKFFGAIVKVQAKPKRRGLIRGTRPGWKKAIVKLHEGNTIQIFEGAQV